MQATQVPAVWFLMLTLRPCNALLTTGDDFLGAVGVDDSRGLKWLNDGIKDTIAKWPFLWFFVNMMWLLLVSLALRTLMQHLVKAAEGAVSQAVVINRRIDREALGKFLESRTMDTADAVADTVQSLKKVRRHEQCGGEDS